MSTVDAAEDLRLPQTVVARIIKDVLPAGVIVSKEARIAIARSAAVFVLHASTYAQECAVANKRKTVTAADILSAMRVLECDDLERPIKDAVELWKNNRQQKLDDAKKRKAERAQLAAENSANTSISDDTAQAMVHNKNPDVNEKKSPQSHNQSSSNNITVADGEINIVNGDEATDKQALIQILDE